MNQYESNTISLATGLLVLFCLAVSVRRFRVRFTTIIPHVVSVVALLWLLSVVVVVEAGLIMSELPSPLFGLIFGFMYMIVVLTSSVVLTGGVFELGMTAHCIWRGKQNSNRLSVRA